MRYERTRFAKTLKFEVFMIKYRVNKQGLVIIEKDGMYFPLTLAELEQLVQIQKQLVSGQPGDGT